MVWNHYVRQKLETFYRKQIDDACRRMKYLLAVYFFANMSLEFGIMVTFNLLELI